MEDFSPRDLADSLLTGPHYEPPYAGAVQDELAWHAVKYLREDARLESECAIEIPGALFSLDFLLSFGDRKIALETGGARTLRDGQRLLRRDAALLSTGRVETVYRLRGSDLLYHMEDVLYLVSAWEAAADPRPEADPFSQRGRMNLHSMASPQAKAVRLRAEQASVLVTYPLNDEEGHDASGERALWHAANDLDPFILLRRLSVTFPDVWQPYAS